MANLIGSNIHVLSNLEMAKHNPSSSVSHWVAQTQVISLLKLQIDKDKQKVKSEERKIPDIEESAKVNGEHLDDKHDYKPSEHMNDKQEYEYDEKNRLVHINIIV